MKEVRLYRLHLVGFHLHDIGKSKAVKTENSSVVARDRRKKQGLTTKGHEETLQSDGNILCLDCGGGYRTVCVCQNVELYT